MDAITRAIRGSSEVLDVTLTREIALAAAQDAGNRNMRKAGRKKWNSQDWRAAAMEFERLWPEGRKDDRTQESIG